MSRAWRKIAAQDLGQTSMVQETSATSPVPSIVSANKPAPSLKAPTGLASGTTYSKVNTGAPPVPRFGLEAKTIPPRGMESLPRKTAQVNMRTMISRPSFQELMAAAMEGTMDKVAVAREATRQQQGRQGGMQKTAAAVMPKHVPTELVHKLASAARYIAKLAEEGSIQMVGEGPGALEVSEATNTGTMPGPGQMGEATAAHQSPMSPSLQAEVAQTGKANTGLETNDTLMFAPYPTAPIANEGAPLTPPTASEKTSALIRSNWNRLLKVGSPTHLSTGIPISFLRKLAEDAENPAQISSQAPPNPPPATATGEGVPAEPSDVDKQKTMIADNQAAIDYTKGEAKKDPISDVEQVVTEPAMKDPVLGQVLDQGVESSKMSMAKNAYQIAAARALLRKLAQEQEEKKEEKANGNGESCSKDNGNGKNGNGFPFQAKSMEKEKEGQMGMTMPASFSGPPPTPAGATGMNTGA